MANRFDVKTKTFFQIPPKTKGCSRSLGYFDGSTERVVFMHQGFDLDDIKLITECVQVGELWYQFSIHIGYSEDRKLNFDFKRKADCLMAQQELSRAWTRTQEFAYADENVDAGESTTV